MTLPELHKVKAHADNQYHNLLDKRIKEHFQDIHRTYTIDVNYSKIQSITYTIVWGDILIEKQLRRFVRHYTEICNIEDFLKLNRNLKQM